MHIPTHCDPPHNEPSIVVEAKLAVDDLIFIAEHEGKLIGACMADYDGHRGWLYAVDVLKDQLRSDTGAALVKYPMKSLKEIGCVKVNLQIRSSNTEVAAFYNALGFATEERLSMVRSLSKMHNKTHLSRQPNGCRCA